jgi:hypothetical protein
MVLVLRCREAMEGPLKPQRVILAAFLGYEASGLMGQVILAENLGVSCFVEEVNGERWHLNPPREPDFAVSEVG